MTTPRACAIVKTGSSTGFSVTLIGRMMVRNPARLKVTVCSPILAFNTHGVTQDVPGSPSRMTVAPEGWLRMGTSMELGILAVLGFGSRGLAGGASTGSVGWTAASGWSATGGGVASFLGASATGAGGAAGAGVIGRGVMGWLV